uniref:GG11693 n=1 Tax=Drosophila erecta TaxID=7220 RepID=B3P5D4_DROER
MKVKVERTTKKPAISKPEDPDPAEQDRVRMEEDDPDDQENQAVEEEELDFLPADLSTAISTATTKIATPTRNLIGASTYVTR